MTTKSKTKKRRLRELAELAYRRELARELATLDKHFESWRKGETTPWELGDLIHKFHDGRSRDLYVYYTRGDRSDKVARAIVIGLLSEAEVGKDLLEELGPMIEYHREADRSEE